LTRYEVIIGNLYIYDKMIKVRITTFKPMLKSADSLFVN